MHETSVYLYNYLLNPSVPCIQHYSLSLVENGQLVEMWKDRERPTKIVSFMSLVLYPWDPFDRRLGAPPKPV
jgi:hypothetical protein